VTNNRARVFGELLALDAWHEPFPVDGKSSAVHVELSFHEGRIGGRSSDFPFTFTLNLKRATLTVRLEPPLEIERNTVARSVPDSEIELTRIRVAKDAALAALHGSARLNPVALAAALSVSAKKTTEVSAEEALRVVQTLPETLVSPRPGGTREYSWELEPTYRESLRGQPWNPVEVPRLRVRIGGDLPTLAPTIKAEITCNLCDLDIRDIQLKRGDIGSKVKRIVFNEINEAAAIQHLKLVLRDAQLEPGTLDNRFSNILLASVLAIPA